MATLKKRKAPKLVPGIVTSLSGDEHLSEEEMTATLRLLSIKAKLMQARATVEEYERRAERADLKVSRAEQRFMRLRRDFETLQVQWEAFKKKSKRTRTSKKS